MHGIQMAQKGRKRKFRGTNPGRNPDKRPDDRLLSSLQPHRRWLPEAVRLSEKAGSVLGCLNLKNLISDEECEAGRLYSVAVGQYRALIGGPSGVVQGYGRGYGCNPIGCPPAHCECLRRTAEYIASRLALAEAGCAALRAVERLVLEDIPPVHMADAKCGLSALQVHYGLTAGRKSNRRQNAS